MNFRKVLEILIPKFNEKDIDFALMGGFALNLWGIIRTTQDIDFLILLDKAGEADQIMRQLNEVLGARNALIMSRLFGCLGEWILSMPHRKYTRVMLRNALRVKVLNNR